MVHISHVSTTILERRNMASSLSQELATPGNVCTTVSRAAEKVEEEWYPRSVDVLVFYSHQLHRFLLLYCDDDQVLEDVRRSIRLLAEIEESMKEVLWLCGI